MKKFRFRLEKVLQYRNIVKDEKRRVLLLKNLKLQEARDRLNGLESAALQLKFEENMVLSAEQLQIAGFYGEWLKDEIARQGLLILQLEQEVQQALAEYTAAAREAKSLEILKQKRLQDYTEYVQKEEEKFVDELSVQKGRRTVRPQERL